MNLKEISLVKNSAYSVFYSLLNSIFPFFIYMYVARILMPDNLGQVAAAQNNKGYFTMILVYGVSAYGVKMIAQSHKDSNTLSRTFSEIALLNTVLSLLCVLIYLSMVLAVPHFRTQIILYLITGLDILLNICNVDWLFQGLEKYAYIAKRGLFVKLITLTAIFLFVKDSDDFLIYAAISVFSISGNYVMNLFFLHSLRHEKGLTLFTDLSDTASNSIKQHLRHIMILCVAGIAAEIYSLADITMLDLMCDSSATGYYNLTARSISALRSVTFAMSAVFLPRMSILYESGDKEAFHTLVNKGMRVVLGASLPVSIGFFLVADDATRLFFGEAFMPSASTSMILAFSVIASTISNYIGLQVLVILNKKKITTISNICGAGTNVILNLFLIRLYAQNGAAIASLVTCFMVTLVQITLSRKYIRISFPLIKPLLSCAAMAGGVYLVHMNVSGRELRLTLSVLIGALLYLCIYFGLTKLGNHFRKLFRPGKGVYTTMFEQYRLSDADILLLHHDLMKIFLTFKDICDENNLRYMMWCGNLVGTVIYKGFVPWDDDIDVMITREDYDRFVEIFTARQQAGDLEDYLLAEPLCSEGYYFKIPKLYLKNTDYTSINYMGNPRYNMIGIDIFILEKVPANRVTRELRRRVYNFAYYASALCLDYKYPSPVIMQACKSNKELASFYGFRRRLGAFFSYIGGMRFYLKICGRLAHYKRQSPYRMILSGTIREVFSDDDLAIECYGEYSGHTVRIPKNYDRYLRGMYGDYTKPPKEQDREIHVAYSFHPEGSDKPNNKTLR